jgi:hypothetical protein
MECAMGWARARSADVPGPGSLLSPAAGIDPGPLLGDWVNYDRNTTGIGTLAIRRRSGGIGVSVLDAGPLWPPEVGETTGSAFAGSAGEMAATGFTARFGPAGLDVLLAAYLNLRLLVVDAYAVRPGAANHFHRDHFYQP